MAEYIEREALLEEIDDIWDCADMVFETNDHCCHDGDCEGCKWAETKNAIRKIIADFPAADVVSRDAYDQIDWERCVALTQLKEIGKSFGERMDDVRPVVRGKWKYRGQQVIDDLFPTYACSVCHDVIPADWRRKCNFCPNCGADMREES